MFLAAKALDTSRPVLDTSGYAHRVLESDIYDSHDYILTEDFADGLDKFQRRHAVEDAPNRPIANHEVRQSGMFVNETRGAAMSVEYRGQPYFVSEMGGFRWNPAAENDDMILTDDKNTVASESKNSWGYGAAPQTMDDFYHRFEAVCGFLLDHPRIFGYCYTQLTDIFPEENGLFGFDRTARFSVAKLKAMQNRKAAIENETE